MDGSLTKNYFDIPWSVNSSDFFWTDKYNYPTKDNLKNNNPSLCIDNNLMKEMGIDGEANIKFTFLCNRPVYESPQYYKIWNIFSLQEPNVDHLIYTTRPCSECGEPNFSFAFYQNTPLCRSCYEKYGSSIPFDDESHFRIIDAHININGHNLIHIENSSLTLDEFVCLAKKSIDSFNFF